VERVLSVEFVAEDEHHGRDHDQPAADAEQAPEHAGAAADQQQGGELRHLWASGSKANRHLVRPGRVIAASYWGGGQLQILVGPLDKHAQARRLVAETAGEKGR